MAVLNTVLLLALCASAIAEVAKITSCPNVPEDSCPISEVRINPCKNSAKRGYCEFKKRQTASISFDFTPSFGAEHLSTSVFWANGATDVAFTGFGSDNGCEYTSCPIEAGKTQTFNYEMYIGAKLPKGSFPIKWVVKNKDNESQLCCFQTSIRIK